MFETRATVHALSCAAQVYLRAHPSLQGDMEQWASALSALGERSQPALRFLMGFLTGDVRITQTISASLFGCEGDCLCLADAYDYLVINYLTATEIVSGLHCSGAAPPVPRCIALCPLHI